MFPVLFAALRPCSCLTKAPARPLWRTAWIVNEHRCIAYRDVMRISGHIGGGLTRRVFLPECGVTSVTLPSG